MYQRSTPNARPTAAMLLPSAATLALSRSLSLLSSTMKETVARVIFVVNPKTDDINVDKRSAMAHSGNMQFPKPVLVRRKPYKDFPDGRFVWDTKTAAGKAGYQAALAIMRSRQKDRCAICALIVWLTFDHQNGRGHGGSIRDDRTEIDGRWFNAALCVPCQGLKGSTRYHWVGKEYVPQETT
jgi:hypothetical protein